MFILPFYRFTVLPFHRFTTSQFAHGTRMIRKGGIYADFYPDRPCQGGGDPVRVVGALSGWWGPCQGGGAPVRVAKKKSEIAKKVN